MKVQLNAWDRRLLDRHLRFYLDLESGERTPTTLAQQHFVDVCLNRVRPRTQHEIAFTKWRALQEPGGYRYQHRLAGETVGNVPAIEPSVAAIETVDLVEDAQLEAQTSWASDVLGRISDLYRAGEAKAKRWSNDAALWASTALSDPDFQLQLDRWTRDQWGGLSDIYTKAMYGAYADGLKAGAEYVSPWVHRILDHDIPTTVQRVRDALPDDAFSEEVIGWLRAYTSDLVTPAGMPLMSLTRDQIDALEKLAQHFGLPVSWLYDALTFTGTEVIASALPGIALAMNWNKAEAETFAELCGAMLVGAGVAANPILAIIALAALAKAWDASRHDTDKSRVAKSIAAGAALSGVVLATSAAIAGPPLVGVIAGIGVAATFRAKGRAWNADGIGGWLRSVVSMHSPALSS